METEGPGLIFTLAAFIAGFSFLVFIHEWGHYKMARIFKVRIETFSIGMGKEIWGRTDKNGTRWRFSAIPLGGYVKFFGDASAASNPGDIPEGLSAAERDSCFHFKPLWQRALIIFAGPAINLIAAVLILAGLTYTYGIDVTRTEVAEVLENSAAEQAGLQAGDVITAVNGVSTERFSQLSNIVRMYPEQQVTIDYIRNGAAGTTVTILGLRLMEDRFKNEYRFGYLGVRPTASERIQVGVGDSLVEGVATGIRITRTMLTTLGEIIIGLRSVKELGGPVKIAKTVGEAASLGFASFVSILGLLSLNLGIVNLLPIPVLDGGHLMFYAAEAVKGSPLSKKAQEAGFIAGAALMLIFMVLVTLNDLQSLAS